MERHKIEFTIEDAVFEVTIEAASRTVAVRALQELVHSAVVSSPAYAVPADEEMDGVSPPSSVH